MISSLKKKLMQLIQAEKSPARLSASFCVGTFIAILPVIPFQTPGLFVVCWLFSLNLAVTFAATYLVNNPFTLIPIYIMDYAFGVWFFKNLLGWNLDRYNPWWVEKGNDFLSQYIDIKKYLGSDFCIWYLVLGGFVLAALVSVILYPFLKIVFRFLIAQSEKMGVEDK
ncbi:DUF2062 domain-containing protein [Candidatus Dependentiae bacterium]|nr:DUF2062 domain-containing protein [Candidatus Dependentiae bacterium]